MIRLGTRQELTEEEVIELQTAASTLCSDIAAVAGDRDLARKRYYCQSPYGLDGVRRSAKGEKIKPFKGSANNAIRWGEEVVDVERCMILEMLRRAERIVVARGGGEASDRRASALSKLLDWGIAHMGSEWTRQLTLALNYALVDTPGVALVTIAWEKRKVVAPRLLTIDDCTVAMVKADNSLGENLIDNLRNGLTDDRYAVALSAGMNLTQELAEEVLDCFQDDDEVEVVAPIGEEEGPMIAAWQYGSDFLVPRTCTKLDYASPWFRREWVTEARLRELATAGDWDEAFVEAALEHKGEAPYNFEEDGIDWTDRQEMVCLIWAYTVRHEHGVLSRWETVMCAAPGITACGRELLRGHRGRFPAVFLARERNSDRVLDSRGVASISSPTLDLAKKLTDTGSNNAIIGGLPPLTLHGSATKVALNPLSVISLRSGTELRFLHPPAYPAQGNNEVERLRRELFDYFGLTTKDADADVVAIRRRARMAALLDSLKDVLEGVLSCIQANASQRVLLEVLGKEAADPQLRREISGNFQLQLKVNIDDLVIKSVIEKVTALGQVIAPLDRNHQVDTAPILRCAVRNLFPNLSEETVTTEVNASQRELREEQDNFVKIKAGLKPPMNVDGGWNYEVRLAFWQQQLQENPQAIDEMSPEAQQFAQEWMQALQQQVQQYGANADLGRTGSPDVMPE